MAGLWAVKLDRIISAGEVRSAPQPVIHLLVEDFLSRKRSSRRMRIKEQLGKVSRAEPPTASPRVAHRAWHSRTTSRLPQSSSSPSSGSAASRTLLCSLVALD